MIIDKEVFILPGPYLTVQYVIKLLGGTYLYKCIGTTLVKMISGFAISFVIAFILGALAGNSSFIKEILQPLMLVLRSVPTASLVYLFLLLAGVKLAPIYIVVLIALPILYEAIEKGIEEVPKDIIQASQVDGSNIFDLNVRVKIPLAMPYILVGINSSFALSFKIEIMAEVITGSSMYGLGSAIVSAQRSDPTNMVPVFAYSLVAIVIMLLIDNTVKTINNKYQK